MKYKLLFLCTAILLCALLLYSSQKSELPPGVAEVKVLEVHTDGLMLVEDCRAQSNGYKPIYHLGMGGQNFQVGDIIRVHYDGWVLECYPARFSGVSSLELVEHPKPELSLPEWFSPFLVLAAAALWALYLKRKTAGE
ncbi:MAG: hypothetical protein ACOX81_02165 [Candidatus Heteroscillospira sp.]